MLILAPLVDERASSPPYWSIRWQQQAAPGVARMFGSNPGVTPQTIAFLLLPRFSMMAFTSSLEPLRAANRLSGRQLYRWRTLSSDGQPVVASNGVASRLNRPPL